MLKLNIISTHLILFDFIVYSCEGAIIYNPAIQCHLEDDWFREFLFATVIRDLNVHLD